MTRSILQNLVNSIEAPEAFAFVLRDVPGESRMIDAFVGDMQTFDTLASIPLASDEADNDRTGEEILVLVPYRQLRERGYDAVNDGEPLQAMLIRRHERIPVAEVTDTIRDIPIKLSGAGFDLDDDAYAALVRKVVADEIGYGAGSNFVLRRTFVADISDYGPRVALAAFRRLIQSELGAYWTFIVHTGTRTLIGASPERQVSVRDGVAVMNPISGTYRYPASGPTLDGVLEFLSDTKEQDELYMVVDEELKMMANFCRNGGRVVGPYLKEMSHLAHTEYLIEGNTTSDPRLILHHTLFAPTVTGSPIENACRVIARYEPEGRGYYAGVLALIGRDSLLQATLDSIILIRTADIDANGRMRIGVGATIVRDSDPASEAAESDAKARALLAALRYGRDIRFGENPMVRNALRQRNTSIADFWLADAEDRIQVDPTLRNRKALVVDAEDAFTAMLEKQLSALGLHVTTCGFDAPPLDRAWDLVVMGPGPGDPRNSADPRIANIRSAMNRLLAENQTFLAVCLSHQVLCLALGLDLIRRASPNQGVQREIDLYGDRELVGFYNTYAARCDQDQFRHGSDGLVEVSRDPLTNEVHALRSDRFVSIQFHAESILTQRGRDIIAASVKRILIHESDNQLVEPGRLEPDHRFDAQVSE